MHDRSVRSEWKRRFNDTWCAVPAVLGVLLGLLYAYFLATEIAFAGPPSTDFWPNIIVPGAAAVLLGVAGLWWMSETRFPIDDELRGTFCDVCGYDLRGLPDGAVDDKGLQKQCPECGRAGLHPAERRPMTWGAFFRQLFVLAPGILMLVGGVICGFMTLWYIGLSRSIDW